VGGVGQQRNRKAGRRTLSGSSLIDHVGRQHRRLAVPVGRGPAERLGRAVSVDAFLDANHAVIGRVIWLVALSSLFGAQRVARKGLGGVNGARLEEIVEDEGAKLSFVERARRSIAQGMKRSIGWMHLPVGQALACPRPRGQEVLVGVEIVMRGQREGSRALNVDCEVICTLCGRHSLATGSHSRQQRRGPRARAAAGSIHPRALVVSARCSRTSHRSKGSTARQSAPTSP
jgi:hypothetical protein